MTAEGWRQAVIQAVRESDDGHADMIEMLAHLLAEQEKAKQDLRNIGFGWCGLNWPGTVQLIADAVAGEDFKS